MATFTGFLIGSTAGHPSKVRTPYMVESVVNFEEQIAASGDVYQMIQVPAETLILHAGAEIVAAVTSGGSVDFDVDTGVTANQWVAAYSTLTVGYMSIVDDTSTSPLQRITTADTIDLTCNTSTATVGIIRVYAVLLDVSDVEEEWLGSDATTTL